MVFMRLPVPHFHHVVAAGLFLGFSGLAGVHADEKMPPSPPLGALPAQDVPPQGDSPAPGDPRSDDRNDAESGETSGDPLAEPAETAAPTAEAQLRAREDLDLLFAELAQPDGESWSRAETDILRIWSRSGSSAMDLLYKRGEAALDAGESEAAIGHLTALTDHAPDFAAGWYLRAVAFYLNGDFGPALADLERVLALEPRHFAALTQLGAMMEELGDRPRAIQAFRESLKIHPNQQDARDALDRLEQETQGMDA